MEDILQQVIINKDSVYHELNKFLENFDGNELIDILDNIDRRKLYRSYFHGLHHSQKVCFFAYLIAKNIGLNDTDLKIMLDAAVYHDIGRMNDAEEEFHGFKSASRILEEFNDEFYKNQNNLTYLRAICESHSMDDSKKERIFNNYKYENADISYDKFVLLDTILKDADALDRTRFKQTSNAALKEKFLRMDYSRELISLAYLINNHYTFKMAEIEYDKIKAEYDSNPVTDCFHGIGFNFFNFESILNHGILSKFESIKRNVSTVRNFNGNNKSLWISVVDATKLSQDGRAYNEFIKNGISFYCFVPKLIDGENKSKNGDYNKAINSGEYSDEKFVFDKIDFDNIHSIVINREVWNKSLNELDYLYGSNNYDIISEKINNYAREIKNNSGIDVDFGVVNILLEEYLNAVLDFEKKSPYDQRNGLDEFIKHLDRLVVELNKEIQNWININYQKVLNINGDVKVSDVIKYILKKNKVKISNYYENEEIMIVLNPLTKDFKNNNDKKI